MRTKKLRNLIVKARKGLDWPILDNHDDSPVYRILSDPGSRSHIVHIPADPEARDDGLNYLHELGHAALCEQVHPVFAASSHFSATTGKEQFTMSAPALQAASDWFIGHWLHDMAPRQFKANLGNELEVVEKIFSREEPPPIDVFMDAALVVAQAIAYLDAPVDCGGKLKEAVDAFSSENADKPAEAPFLRLVNSLMAIYTPLRARIANDGEYAVWNIYLPGEGTTERVERSGLSQACA
ncbi:MAG TPA: hypothetical protein VF799_10430 [Geobacteraceae bacterium]